MQDGRLNDKKDNIGAEFKVFKYYDFRHEFS